MNSSTRYFIDRVESRQCRHYGFWYTSRKNLLYPRENPLRFTDTRGSTSYNRSHIYGAVLNTAPDGLETNDPIAAWPKPDRIVCYCACPNHMSSLRAASLLSDGYEEVYAIEEGFTEWQKREYPMAGEDVESRPNVRIIEGQSDAKYAGETAWARHEPTGQREATAIAEMGRITLNSGLQTLLTSRLSLFKHLATGLKHRSVTS